MKIYAATNLCWSGNQFCGPWSGPSRIWNFWAGVRHIFFSIRLLTQTITLRQVFEVGCGGGSVSKITLWNDFLHKVQFRLNFYGWLMVLMRRNKFPSILRHSGNWGVADEAVLNTAQNPKNPPVKFCSSSQEGPWPALSLLIHWVVLL